MSLTVAEAQRAIIILKGIQNKQLKESTIEYLKPIKHKVWHDAVQEQMMVMTLELDKFFKQQADKLYKIINVEKQLFIHKKENKESIAITKALQAIDLIAKADEPKRYKVWQYLDRLYNRVVVKDIKDKIVEYFKSFNKELEKIYHKNIKNTYEKVSQSISTDETPFEFNKSNKWVQKRLKDKAIKWSKQVTKTTENRIKRTLIKGYKAGDSIFDIANRIKKNEGFSFSRAEKIARTEIFSAGNYIDYLSFNQNQDIVGYKWHSMEDKRVRPTHAVANGQFRKKGEPFSVGGSKLLYPGDNSLGAAAKEVICCRCYLDPIFADDELTLEEERAVLNYVSSDAYKINEKLRKGLELNDNDLELVYNLDSALEKMPKYVGNLQRSLKFEFKEDLESFLQKCIIAETITFSEYLSTTKGEIYNPDGEVQIYIENTKSGADISAYNLREQEVLYSRNQTFLVINKRTIGKVTYMLFEEV